MNNLPPTVPLILVQHVQGRYQFFKKNVDLFFVLSIIFLLGAGTCIVFRVTFPEFKKFTDVYVMPKNKVKVWMVLVFFAGLTHTTVLVHVFSAFHRYREAKAQLTAAEQAALAVAAAPAQIEAPPTLPPKKPEGPLQEILFPVKCYHDSENETKSVVGKIQTLESEKNEYENQCKQLFSDLKIFLQNPSVPEDAKRRINVYFENQKRIDSSSRGEDALRMSHFCLIILDEFVTDNDINSQVKEFRKRFGHLKVKEKSFSNQYKTLWEEQSQLYTKMLISYMQQYYLTMLANEECPLKPEGQTLRWLTKQFSQCIDIFFESPQTQEVIDFSTAGFTEQQSKEVTKIFKAMTLLQEDWKEKNPLWGLETKKVSHVSPS